MGAITKGKEIHESWVIDWKDVLFLKPSNINEQRTFLISQDDYLESARRRLAHLLNIGYEPEEFAFLGWHDLKVKSLKHTLQCH